MTSAALSVIALGDRIYRVTGGASPHRVTLDPVACDCADFQYKGVHRTPPSCKHIAAVVAWKAAEPLADLLDGLTESETLDLVDPSHGHPYERREPVAIDPEDRAVAVAALEKWAELRRLKPKPNGYYGLWRAACSALSGLECEKSQPGAAAEYFAIARAWVAQLGQKGRVA
jgi:hypothetical protein